jgi:hypothetical protein
MKQLLLLVCCALSLFSFRAVYSSEVPAPGKKSVVLLISLDPNDNPKGLAGLLHNYKKYPRKLAATFNSLFADSGFDIQVVQNANRYDLYQALHSSNTAGVFWISHETPLKGKEGSIVEVASALLDHQLSDVKSLFEEMNPNVKWVSIVACDSELIINWLEGKSASIDHQIQGFNTPIDANRGLKQAIALAKPVLAQALSEETIKTCPEIQGRPIQIRRELKAKANEDSYFPAVTITIQGAGPQSQLIAAFPEANLKAGESSVQNEAAFIPEALNSSTRLHHLQIVADSGLAPMNLPPRFQMGEFSVNEAWTTAHWQVFEIDGAPIGVTEQILDFDGTIPSDLASQPTQPSACN